MRCSVPVLGDAMLCGLRAQKQRRSAAAGTSSDCSQRGDWKELNCARDCDNGTYTLLPGRD